MIPNGKLVGKNFIPINSLLKSSEEGQLLPRAVAPVGKELVENFEKLVENVIVYSFVVRYQQYCFSVIGLVVLSKRSKVGNPNVKGAQCFAANQTLRFSSKIGDTYYK